MSTPRFLHDCTACEWRGRHGRYDMYFCAKSDGGTVIARGGDDGGDYASYPLSLLFRPGNNEALQRSASFLACSDAALALHMCGRIRVRFEIQPEGE